ncbi:hypothetical protein [Aromatoleum buckelii]|uniref:Uncharacterized protein n=1 Tax=Aromatoleum buckelii TaxID=200254 RepID=A0ABX1N760_9RHOO|nr:hypothetical protein [Aromatoleum buckelii]
MIPWKEEQRHMIDHSSVPLRGLTPFITGLGAVDDLGDLLSGSLVKLDGLDLLSVNLLEVFGEARGLLLLVEPLPQLRWVGQFGIRRAETSSMACPPHSISTCVGLDVIEAMCLEPLAELLVGLVRLPTRQQCLSNLPPQFPLFRCGCLDAGPSALLDSR